MTTEAGTNSATTLSYVNFSGYVRHASLRPSTGLCCCTLLGDFHPQKLVNGPKQWPIVWALWRGAGDFLTLYKSM